MNSFNQSVFLEPHRRRWYQYSVRSLLVLMTLTAIFCTYWVNYRQVAATAKMTYRILLVKAGVLDDVLTKHVPVKIKESPYAWVILNDKEVGSFLKNMPSTLQLHSATRFVSTWPRGSARGSDSCMYTSTRVIPIKGSVVKLEGNKTIQNTFPAIESGALYGFPGFQRIGLSYRFRVEYKAWYRGLPDDEQEMEFPPKYTDSTPSNIFYEGPVPTGHLVFFAPYGSGKYHVIIFDVEPVR